jgi:hypothetical protein
VDDYLANWDLACVGPCLPLHGVGVGESCHVHGRGLDRAAGHEFLTEETTSTSVLPERTTSEIFCQKRPPGSGGSEAQATRGTCRLGQSRQGGAAYAKPGRWPG